MTRGRRSVDLNSDVGESFGRWTLGDDDAVLELVTSANVAGGFHAGDASTLRRCCATAADPSAVRRKLTCASSSAAISRA